MSIGLKWLSLLGSVTILLAACSQPGPTSPTPSSSQSTSNSLGTLEERVTRLEQGMDARVIEFNIVQSAVYQMMIDNQIPSLARPGFSLRYALSLWTNDMRTFPSPGYPLYGFDKDRDGKPDTNYVPFETTIWFYQIANEAEKAGIIWQGFNPARVVDPPTLSPVEAADEALRAELHDVQAAVTAMMTENNLAAIPNPIKYLGATGTNATRNMTAFPDTISEWTGTPGGKVKDPLGVAYAVGDKAGYLLSTHDMAGGGTQTVLVNYVNMKATRFYYTAEADGTVRQWKAAETSDANELASSRVR